MKDSRGGVALLFVFALPLMTASIIMALDIGMLAVARARLKAAADRAAYAAAASMAHSLSGIARENWMIHRAFRDLRDDFASHSQQNEQAARQRIERYEAERDRSLAAISEIAFSMRDRAGWAAHAALLANAPVASAQLVYGGEIRLLSDLDPEEQSERIEYSRITGDLFTDPEDVEVSSYEAFKYLEKEEGPDARVGVSAALRVEPLALGNFLGDGVDVFASSSAQAFGGSIAGFAQIESDTLEEAESFLDEEGFDALYRAALVPAWTVERDDSEEGM